MAPLISRLSFFFSAFLVVVSSGVLSGAFCTSTSSSSSPQTTQRRQFSNTPSLLRPGTTNLPLLDKKRIAHKNNVDHNYNNNNKAIMSASATASTTPTGGGQPPSSKRIRISAFDSMRFFLIVGIVLGHFISFANPSKFWFKAASQHNVVVGAFFALSGYVTAYTSTENGRRQASAKLLDTPKQTWILQRIFGYYPLHLAVLILFSPLFVYADAHYNGWLVTAWHGLLSATMTQAWFPMHAEVWNAPTWFLSALTFATACMPFCLPAIAKQSKPQLRKTAFWLMVFNLLPKLGYWYDFNTLNIAEGVTSPKLHPNLAMFNVQRFLPLNIVAEVLLGVVACRLVMLDGEASDDKDKPAPAPKTNALSTLVPVLAMIGLKYLRASGIWETSDLLIRSVFFVPLFLRLLMSVHRNTVNKVSDPLVSLLSSPFLVALGNLTFPIFIVHGPVGQIFFKKLIANKLFGKVLKGPKFFGLYLATTAAVAWILQKTILQNKAVADKSKATVQQLSKWF